MFVALERGLGRQAVQMVEASVGAKGEVTGAPAATSGVGWWLGHGRVRETRGWPGDAGLDRQGPVVPDAATKRPVRGDGRR